MAVVSRSSLNLVTSATVPELDSSAVPVRPASSAVQLWRLRAPKAVERDLDCMLWWASSLGQLPDARGELPSKKSPEHLKHHRHWFCPPELSLWSTSSNR